MIRQLIETIRLVAATQRIATTQLVAGTQTAPLVIPTVLLALSISLVLAPNRSRAAAGDVTFQLPSRIIHLDPNDLTTGVDLIFEVETAGSAASIGWGIIAEIIPQTGSQGTLGFNPPAIVGNQPNLSPATENPFGDFDRDFDGMSYGMLDGSATRLRAFSTYVEPTLGPAPTLDVNGNLTLPSGSGLASLPIIASSNAAGDFLISFDPDPVVTGVVFATGLAQPNDVAVHPNGSLVAATLNVINPPGDYNGNGKVDAADYTVYRDTLASTTDLRADGNRSNLIDVGDYDTWKQNFAAMLGAGAGTGRIAVHSSAVPEPSSFGLWAVSMLSLGVRFRYIRISR